MKMFEKKNRASSNANWVCPNDRQLLLRAQLRIGWSVKSEQYENYGRRLKPLTEEEQQVISSVIKRAEALEKQEQERIGRLVHRVENMKRNALGSGAKQCILCGDKFGFIISNSLVCHDCCKNVALVIELVTHLASIQKMRSVCLKCGIEVRSGNQKESISLCKICAETREMWKKSGAWFYKGLPKYVLPSKSNTLPDGYQRYNVRDTNWKNISSTTLDVTKHDDEISSDDDVHTISSVPTRRSSSITSPLSPGLDRLSQTSNLSNTSSIIPRMANITITNVNHVSNTAYRNKYQPFNREESSESGSSRTYSSESGGSVPHIFVNYCDSESTSNNRNHSESDKGSVSSGISSHQGGDDFPEDESSPTDSIIQTGNCMGTIELSIQYDPDANSLHISLHRAQGLKGMDINGLADPFCKLNLLPIGAKSYRLRTRTVPKTINPDFHEMLTFYGITDEDIRTQALHILILDDDKYGHDFLGEAKFILNRLKPRVTKNLRLPLEQHIPVGELEDEVWGEGFGSHGQIALTLLYSTRKRSLIVGIVRCVNLIPMDSNGYSDPFVKFWLRSGEGCSPRYKTSVKWKNLNPIYNEEFLLDTKITDLSSKSLVITVWDKDPGRTNDFLGSLELGRNSKGERLRQWIDTIKYPDHKHEGLHNLSGEIINN